ncbi:DUF6463 family protein [Nonomuraea sp. NPDC003804]|uniref:DUF6463 family protein n=1 Tax=Nonomuraea sp. NPDC003804 TaxID=3154547 RepID=UPI0033B1B5B3
MNTANFGGLWARLLGPALLATGLLHLGYGLAIAGEPVRRLIGQGVLGAAPDGSVTETWFWFMVAGVPMLLTGHLVLWARRRTGQVPGFVAPYLALLGLSALLYPVSGLWLFLPLAAVAGAAAPRARARTAAR